MPSESPEWTAEPQTSAAPTPVPPGGPTAGLLVTFTSDATFAQRRVLLESLGAAERDAIAQLRLVAVDVPADGAAAALAALRGSNLVLRAEPDRERSVDAGPSDPRYGEQWALPRIGWPEVYGTRLNGGAIVAILDTGVDSSHPDLAGQLAAGASFVEGSASGSDPNGHGTAMAGIVAAQTDNAIGIAGVGFAGVQVMPVTVLAADGTGRDSDIIAGLVWAVDNGADVISMSFSNPGYSAALQAAIDYAWDRDVVVVAAAGNDGSARVTYPAGSRGVMGISNTDRLDRLHESSNHGEAVFLGAPGTAISATALGGGYTQVSGTSASAALVSASAALLRAAGPGLTNGQIVHRLAATADAAGGRDEVGNGRLNLARAMASESTDSLQPNGAGPLGDGGPIVGPYVAALACSSVSSGSWDEAARWSCGQIPNAADDVTIAAGHAVTIPAGYAAAAQSLTINAGGTSQSLALLDATSSLAVGGSVTVNQPTSGNNSQLIVDAGTATIGGSLTLHSTATNTNRCIRVRTTTGTLTVVGDLVLNNPAQTSSGCGSNGGYGAPSFMTHLDMSGGAGVLNVGGAVTIANPGHVTLGLSAHADSYFNYNGAAAGQTVAAPASANWVYANIHLNNTSGSAVTLGGALGSSKNIGHLRVLSGLFTNSGFAISLVSGRTFEVANGATFRMSGTSGMVTAESGSITKTFGATSTVDYAGTSQAVSAEAYGHLAISGSETKTLAGNATVAGNLTVNAGTLDLAGFTVNRTSAGGTLTVSNGATLKIGGTGSFPANYATRSLGATSTVEYGGTTQTVSGEAYGHLVISGSGTKTLAANATVGGNLTVSGGTFDLGAFTANRSSAGGTLTVAAGASLRIGGTNSLPANYTTVTLSSTSTVDYAGTSQTVSATTYGHLTLSGSGTKTAAGNISLAGGWTNSGVTFAAGSHTVTFNGSVSQAISGSTTFNHLTISKSGGTLDGGSAAITLTGSWTGDGSFNAQSSTVTFTGSAAQTIGGGPTFNNLTVNKSGGSLTLNANATVAGTLTFTNGVLSTGANTLTVSGSISGAGASTGHVNGNLARPVAASPLTFAIGGASVGAYTPITLTGLSGSGTLTASTSASAPASIGDSAIDAAKKANRTWTLTSSGTVSGSYSVALTYLAADLDGGANTATFVVNRLSGGVWTAGTSSSTSSSTTTTQGFSAGTFGEFALGSEKAATKLAFSVQPSDVLVNSPITPAVAVDVRTANDFRATMSSASVTMAIGTNPGGATLGGTTARSATNGQATFNDLTLNVAASGYTLAASSAGLTGATSTSFDVASSPGSCTSLSSGAWDVAARWNCGRVPKTTDDVTIAAGHAVTIPSGVSALAYSVTIAAAGTSQSLDLAAASTSLNVVGNVTISQPTNGNNSQLIVDAGTLTVGGSLTLNGSTTSSNRCMRLRITTGTLSVSGGLVVNNPGTSNTCGSNGGFGAVSAMSQIDMSGGGGSLNVAGQVTISHPANASLALSMHVSSVFNYNGSAAAQTVVLPSATNWTYSNLRTNNTHAGGATLEAAVTATKVTGNLRVLSGTLANGGFAISLANGSTFEVANGARFLMTATSGLPTAASGSITKIFGATSTVEYGGANQAIEVETYGHLALSGSGTKTAAGNISLAGDFTNNGVTFAGSTHTVTLSGSAATQTIGGTADSTFNNLTINKSAGGVSLGRSTTVNGTLALTSGVVTTSTNTLIIGSSGSVNRALCAAPTTSCFVQGNLRKSVATGSSVSRTLEVGTSSTYSPVTVVFDSVSVDGTLTASATGGAHPNLADSDIDTAKYVARYWTLAAAGGLAFTTAGATFSFAAADIQGGGDPNVFIVGRRSGGSWTKPTLGTRSATTTQATGLTGFGDFAVGIQKVYPPTANADAYSVYQGHTLTVAGPGVLGNDTDPQSLSLTVAAPRPASGPSNGSVTLNADGSLSYTPNSGFSGTDSFSYRATNGQVESTAATVTITVLPLAYVSSSSWLSSFDSGRYLALTFPAYLPAAATVEGATFRHTYRSYGGGTTCYYLEVYEGAALIGSHGSAGSPYSCNSGSSFQADVISLPEVNSADRANAAVVRLYVRNSAGGRSEHSLARLDLDYWLGSP
jgi:hypothetical protein